MPTVIILPLVYQGVSHLPSAQDAPFYNSKRLTSLIGNAVVFTLSIAAKKRDWVFLVCVYVHLSIYLERRYYAVYM